MSQFDKFMKDILHNQTRHNGWQLPPLDQQGTYEEYMKRLRMSKAKQLVEQYNEEYLKERIVYETLYGIVEYEKCDVS